MLGILPFTIEHGNVESVLSKHHVMCFWQFCRVFEFDVTDGDVAASACCSCGVRCRMLMETPGCRLRRAARVTGLSFLSF